MAEVRDNIVPEERVQIIALGVHRLADRFSAQEEAFGNRLKDTATSLIEDTARYRIARRRDAAGTSRLVHEIEIRIESLTALVSFVKRRGQTLQNENATAGADLLLWHLAQLAGYFHEEDRRGEAHILAEHPHGAVVAGTFVEREKPQQRPQPISTTQSAPPRPSFSSVPSSRFDPLLGPDSVGESFAVPPPPNRRGVQGVSFAQTTAVNVSDRRARILEFFSAEKRAPLKDVLGLFPNVSEKTIRNDLAEFCRTGTLRRVGMAPRSHYILTA